MDTGFQGMSQLIPPEPGRLPRACRVEECTHLREPRGLFELCRPCEGGVSYQPPFETTAMWCVYAKEGRNSTAGRRSFSDGKKFS
ncbi:hypothetical protein OJAV_G00214700 [Oryzias javanicus]|uniref:Uncharacterized protein n=1 Tax=Oryzias javanicus TaxID=123683 RepID=A0A3S2MDW6_ORYJA|nr:hypothetical protein OJAV_G00214700 [Oryzias javanicus]